jgi:hypothetical protein
MGTFYGTEIEIWAGFAVLKNKFGLIISSF